MSFCNRHEWIYLEAIKSSMATTKSLWKWLCENHPEVALEYEVFVTEVVE